jgi:hypothetical protein
MQLRIRLSVVSIAGDANVLADAASHRQWGRFGVLAQVALACQSPFLSVVLPSLQV